MIGLSIGSTKGFGHAVTAILGTMKYAKDQNEKLYIFENSWKYGALSNIIIPFWKNYNTGEITQYLNMKSAENQWGLQYFYEYLKEDRFVYQEFLEQLFVYNSYTQAYIKDTIKSLNLPDTYMATHFRLGDKLSQHGFNINTMFEAFEKIYRKHCPTHENLFVMTDEYKVITRFKETYPWLNIYTLCPENYEGDPQKIRTTDNMRLLVAEIEIVKEADFFIPCMSSLSHLMCVMRNNKGIKMMISKNQKLKYSELFTNED